MYKFDPDAGIHGAAEWTLRQWNEAVFLKVTDSALRDKPAGERRWRVNSEGITMVKVEGPVTFKMGTPPDEPRRYHTGEETQRRVTIDRGFEIASKEVSVEQFQKFIDDHPKDKKMYHTVQASPSPQGPRVTLSWYKAVEYCNWLSEREKLERCYHPNDGKEFEDGMRTVPNYLECTGYRLPTEAEWEYACRSGTITPWYHGDSEPLLADYAWYQTNAGDNARPAGKLKPNDLGLFDMLGNAMEWCGDGGLSYQTYVTPISRDDRHYAEVIGDQGELHDSRLQRGGSYFFQTTLVRSGRTI